MIVSTLRFEVLTQIRSIKLQCLELLGLVFGEYATVVAGQYKVTRAAPTEHMDSTGARN